MADKEHDDLGSGVSLGAMVLGICLLLAAAVGIWQFVNRERLDPVLGAIVEFVSPPDTVAAGVASRFVVQVELDEDDKSMPGRVLDIKVAPHGLAKILAVSGASGSDYAVVGDHAKGRTDSTGKLDITVQASRPGEYTLVALDSLSNQESSVNFRAVAPGG